MRPWQIWWQTILLSSQYSPPRFVELVMLTLAMILLLVWCVMGTWPYLVLSLSYAIGASTSILVRESLTPSPQVFMLRVTAILLLIISFYSFAELIR